MTRLVPRYNRVIPEAASSCASAGCSFSVFVLSSVLFRKRDQPTTEYPCFWRARTEKDAEAEEIKDERLCEIQRVKLPDERDGGGVANGI